MPQFWSLPSKAPHDFFLTLDIDPYFDYEHQPERIFEEGFMRPLVLKERDVLVTIRYNGDPESPEFAVEAHDTVSDSEKSEIDAQLRRILGTELDANPLYEQAASDPVLAPLFREFYGYKRIARANFWEDAVNRIIQTQISHKPTAKKMVYEVRQAFSPRLESRRGTVASWPRPERLISGDPVAMKKHGLSLRKGEYLVGLAQEFVSGRISNTQAEHLAPQDFYERMLAIRGIGPTTAQDLMFFRNRPDAVFPSQFVKGQERGLRRWILMAYGLDPDHSSENEFLACISKWRGYESMAIEFLFANYYMNEKKKRARK